MLRYFFIVWAGFYAALPVAAATWADGLFEELNCDFGSVPRGPVLTHPFRITNNTRDTVHIAGIRVSCGCTAATPLRTELEPGQSTAVVAQMDTRRFGGVKNVTIYVQFDRPQWEEVRLWVQANSRDDLTITPEALAFGTIKRGTAPTASVNVSFLGNAAWQVLEAQCDTNYIQTKVEEVRRDTGEVVYKLTAQVRKDAPVGKWYTDIWLKTNDAATARVRVPLNVEIDSALSVSPTVAELGKVKVGAETERKIILRGVKPFRIERIEGADAEVQVKDSTPTSNPVHVLTVKVKVSKPGEWTRNLRVRTDLKGDNDIEFQARAEVVP
jgi:hypothetical protein